MSQSRLPRKGCEPFRALLEQAVVDAGPEANALPSPILARVANVSAGAISRRSEASEIRRTPTRPDKPKARRQGTLATEPTRKRRAPRPAPEPLDIELSMPSIGTLDGDVPVVAENASSEAVLEYDTQEDLDSAIDAALDDDDAGQKISIPDSIAAGTDLFQKQAFQEQVLLDAVVQKQQLQQQNQSHEEDDAESNASDRSNNEVDGVRAERPLKKNFFAETTKRLSPFDPSSIDCAPHEAHATDDDAPIGEQDAATANGDDVIDRMMAKVREERAFADGHPVPPAESIDLAATPKSSTPADVDLGISRSNSLMEALDVDDSEEDKGHAVSTDDGASFASESADDTAELTRPSRSKRSATSNVQKSKQPFASMLAESLSLAPLSAEPQPQKTDSNQHAKPLPAFIGHYLPPEFSLQEVDGLGRLANGRSESKNELADVSKHEPLLLEPVNDAVDSILPVSVGTPTCHWRLDATGQPQLAAISLDPVGAPVPIDDFADQVESGSINLADIGMNQDDFAPIREATGRFRAYRAQNDVAANTVPSPLHLSPAPFEFDKSPRPVAEPLYSVEDLSNGGDALDGGALDERDLDGGALEGGALDERDLDDSDLDASILADVSLSGLEIGDVQLNAGRVDVDRVEVEADELPADNFGDDNFGDDSMLDVSLTGLATHTGEDISFSDASLADLSLSDLSLSGLSFVADSRGALAADDAFETNAALVPSTTTEAGEDSSISTQDLAMPSADVPRIRPAAARRTEATTEEGITTIPLRESVAHLRALQSATAPRPATSRVKPPLSRLKVEGKAVTEAARIESAVPPAAARPPMVPPAVARPREFGADGDRLRKGHDLYLLAMEKLDAGRTSEALLNAKLAAAYDPDNTGYRELVSFVTNCSRQSRPALQAAV